MRPRYNVHIEICRSFDSMIIDSTVDILGPLMTRKQAEKIIEILHGYKWKVMSVTPEKPEDLQLELDLDIPPY